MTGHLQASGPLHALSLSSVGHSESRGPWMGGQEADGPLKGPGAARPIYGEGRPPSDGAEIDG